MLVVPERCSLRLIKMKSTKKKFQGRITVRAQGDEVHDRVHHSC
jgi:hypothetical protein